MAKPPHHDEVSFIEEVMVVSLSVVFERKIYSINLAITFLLLYFFAFVPPWGTLKEIFLRSSLPSTI